MKYKVTLKNGDAHEFASPLLPTALRKVMNLPYDAILEQVQIEGAENGTFSESNAGTVAAGA